MRNTLRNRVAGWARAAYTWSMPVDQDTSSLYSTAVLNGLTTFQVWAKSVIYRTKL